MSEEEVETEASSVLCIAQRVAKNLTDAKERTASASLDEMLPHVYQDLRRLGRSLMRTETKITLQATAVVNEAYMRLAQIDPEIHDLKHCFRLLAQTMRRVLIDHGRARRRNKRELITKEELEVLIGNEHDADTTADIIDIDRALARLTKIDAETVEIIQLSGYFGVELTELAHIFGVSEATVSRKLRFGKSCLARFLDEAQDQSEPGTWPDRLYEESQVTVAWPAGPGPGV